MRTLEGVAHPLADPQTEVLRLDQEAKNRTAQDAWKAFATRRDELVKDGRDLANDKAAFGEVKELHDAYEAAAKVAEDARDAYLKHLEGRNGIGVKREVLPGALPDNLSKSFIEGLGAKAVDATSGGTATSQFYDPRIRELPQRALFVRSVIPTVSVDTDKVDYLRQVTATNNAAPVAAGALKPTSVFSMERVEASVTTVAHLSEPVDRALLLGMDNLADWLDNQLRLGVLLAEETLDAEKEHAEAHAAELREAAAAAQAEAADIDTEREVVARLERLQQAVRGERDQETVEILREAISTTFERVSLTAGKKPGTLLVIPSLKRQAVVALGGPVTVETRDGSYVSRAQTPRRRPLPASLTKGRARSRSPLMLGRSDKGDSGAALSAGTNDLLRQGAAPLLSADDILGAIGLERAPPARTATLSPAAEAVSATLRDGARAADELVRAVGLGSAEVAAALVELELAGLATSADGVYRCPSGR